MSDNDLIALDANYDEWLEERGQEIEHPFVVPLTNVCKESKSSPRLNCVESATCESQQ